MFKFILFFLLGFVFYSTNAQTSDEELNNSDDSLFQRKQNEFLTPLFIYKNIGKPNINKDKLEKDLNLRLAMHRGGVDYYQINETLAGLRFFGKNLSEISFRYFGEEGPEYEKSLLKSGFTLRSRRRTSSFELEPDLDSQVLDGELRIYQKGNVICKVYDGSYLAFNFYKTGTH